MGENYYMVKQKFIAVLYINCVYYCVTGYRKTTVRSPNNSFDRLKEEFYVLEDNGDELVLIVEEFDTPLEHPVRNLIEEEFSLDDLSMSGQSISYQDNLPAELQNETKYEIEQNNLKPANEIQDRPVNDIKSVISVLEAIKSEETDQDHIKSLEDSIDRIYELYSQSVTFSSDGSVSAEDVLKTLDILEEEGVEYRSDKEKHPNNTLAHTRYDVYIHSYEIGTIPKPAEKREIVF